MSSMSREGTGLVEAAPRANRAAYALRWEHSIVTANIAHTQTRVIHLAEAAKRAEAELERKKEDLNDEVKKLQELEEAMRLLGIEVVDEPTA